MPPSPPDTHRPGNLKDLLGAKPLAVEGLFQSLGQSLGEAYIGAFALFLNAGAFSLGLVGSVPTAGTALAQAVAGRLRAGGGGAKRFVARMWSLQAMAYVLLGACVFVPSGWSIPALVTLALITWGLAGITVPSWSALVFGIVPRKRQGEFFALRGMVQQIGVVVAILGGGALLAATTSHGLEWLGFLLLFVFAGAARLSGNSLLSRVPEQAERGPAADLAAGIGMLRSSAKFRRLCFYLWGLHFGTHVAAPFFVPYMLRELELGYGVVGLLIAVPALTKALTLRFWGRLADRLGSGVLLRTAGWLVVPVSACWMLSGNPWWLMAVQLYSGIAWGAFELSQAAALVQTTRGREAAVALFNLADGLILIAGSLVGGTIIYFSGSLGGSGYLHAFGGSSILRALPAAVLLWRIRGVELLKRSHLGLPLRIWAIRPTRGALLRPLGGLGGEEERDDEGR